MARIVLLSCTKSKLDKKSQAQDLYSASPMFRKTLEYGKSLKPDKMYILSAKHNLTPLTMMLDPYDLTLKEMKKDEKEAWGEKTISQMKSSGINPEKDTFIFLAGTEYIKPLLKYIPEANIEEPMKGKRFGERLKWLNTQIQKLGEIIKKIKNMIYETYQRKFK
jgi:hypothetical protein|tara:strand:+ start:2535 stop:3026 length:492 start_codon:yes stop_codon:yes gene_type:complete